MDSFSLLILIKGRESHLQNVLLALEQSSHAPSEIILVHMNEPIAGYYSSIPLHEYSIHSDSPLPLAHARNMAAKKASNDVLIFLDVDCIPSPNAFKCMIDDLAHGQLVMADPKYLSNPVNGWIDFEKFDQDSSFNPARSNLVYGASQHYEMFWSLAFAMRKKEFIQCGGFDERYVGYGGEDTDFAFSVRRDGLSLFYSRAIVYHQNHTSYDPPLNWLNDIVSNANVFYEKWHIWPMEGWLTKFESMGFIRRSADTISILRSPTKQDIEAHLKQNAL